MADVKKIATREGYGAALVELGKLHDNVIVFDADLAGATKTSVFKKAFPARHLDCGIAEGNLMAVAAGAAPAALVPFAARPRARRFPSVLRGLRPDALHPRQGGHESRRRSGGPGHGLCRLRA